MTPPTDALEADRAELLRICAGLDEAGWRSESGCPGWSVKDLVAYMGTLFWAVVDPSVLPDAAGLPTEQAAEVFVQARRSLSAAQVLDDYAAVSEKALVALAGLTGVDFEMPLGDLGTYPARILPAAYCFDHYTHIRADLFAPRGPLSGPPPPSDELRLLPTMDWIEAALLQQKPFAGRQPDRSGRDRDRRHSRADDPARTIEPPGLGPGAIGCRRVRAVDNASGHLGAGRGPSRG